MMSPILAILKTNPKSTQKDIQKQMENIHPFGETHYG